MEIQLLTTTTSDPQLLHQELEQATTSVSQHWVVTDNETERKIRYIFRPNGDLLRAPLRVRQVAQPEQPPKYEAELHLLGS